LTPPPPGDGVWESVRKQEFHVSIFHPQGKTEILGVHVGHGLFVRLDKLKAALENLSQSLRQLVDILDPLTGVVEFKVAKEQKRMTAFHAFNAAFVVVKNMLFPSNTPWLFQAGMSRRKSAEQNYCVFRLGLAVGKRIPYEIEKYPLSCCNHNQFYLFFPARILRPAFIAIVDQDCGVTFGHQAWSYKLCRTLLRMKEAMTAKIKTLCCLSASKANDAEEDLIDADKASMPKAKAKRAREPKPEPESDSDSDLFVASDPPRKKRRLEGLWQYCWSYFLEIQN
jgi:hypothetical protein